MPILLFSLVGLAFFKPKLLRKLFGHIEPLEIVRTKPVEADYVNPPENDQRKPHWADISKDEMVARSQQLARTEQLKWRTQPPPNASQSAPIFGRRRA